ncbi:glycosyltransferase family 4 protein [Psychrobacter sp.]|uniref:glycosyltransferase family 4 protein n=1 Tax=Psychrobacter sp. TaxID=56811 RepID=UPI0035639702
MTAGISLWELIKNRTLKDFILFDGILERKRKYYKRGRSEIKAIKNLDYVLGRTFWDFAQVKSLNPSVNYYSCERSLRREFFDKSWNIDNVKAFSIFVSQCHTPFKGLHILLKAVYILKKDYPDIRVNIAGIDITSTKSLIEKLKIGTYGKFLTSLIKNLKLTENIKFLGTLNADGMAQNLSDSHCFVMPSFIENSPNSLAEAMLVGTPSIASFVGGAPEVIKHGENGYLYNPYEPESLAYYIDKVFNSDELSSSLSINGRLESRGKHVSDGNANNLLKAYKEIIVDYEEK